MNHLGPVSFQALLRPHKQTYLEQVTPTDVKHTFLFVLSTILKLSYSSGEQTEPWRARVPLLLTIKAPPTALNGFFTG